MCGIVGFAGDRDSQELLEDLEKLAYRGYDSAGVALLTEKGLSCIRAPGKLENLRARLESKPLCQGSAGIGHTRWATHGAPTEENAHPHLSRNGKVAVVHNGIVENWHALKEELIRDGVSFSSQTDTEVIPHLIEKYLTQTGSPHRALQMATARLRGAYALAVLFTEDPEALWGVRYQSPLVAAVVGDTGYLASDIPALLDKTDRVIDLEQGDTVRLFRGTIQIWDAHGDPKVTVPRTVTWSAAQAQKGGYDTFMEKELWEVPLAVEQTRKTAEEFLEAEGSTLAGVSEICFLGCGSAWHVGVMGQYTAESLLSLPVRVEPASEMRYRNVPLRSGCLCVAVSQSGETADTLAALDAMRERGVPTLGIVNVVGSALSRRADKVLYTAAGPEIAVATTKAYGAQLLATWSLLRGIARERGMEREVITLGEGIKALPDALRAVLARYEEVYRMAEKIKDAHSAFFIGRGQDYAACMEGSLKLKEITYIHAEAYPAGELKHGTISLITPGTPVVACITDPALASKTLAGVEEVKARGGVPYLFVGQDIQVPRELGEIFLLPPCPSVTAPAVAVLAMQLLAYRVSRLRGLDPDRPRNLAKSVTVE